MKKSHVKLAVFDIFLIIVLLLNSFILSILNTYLRMSIFVLILLVIFKILFGFEKDNHRYTKDIMMNITIIYLSSFIVYYLFGLIIGFVRTNTHYSFYGIRTFIIPYVLMIIAKEYLRYQMITKSQKSKYLLFITFVIFVLIDVTNNINSSDFGSYYGGFIFFAVNLLPAISNNIVANYIVKKVGYKNNILWLLIAGLYANLLPIVPNTGLYVGSMIKFLFPLIILYNIYLFWEKKSNNVPTRDSEGKNYLVVSSLLVFIAVLVYFTSGYFRFYIIAIATGSMTPNIYKGDIVVIDKKFDYSSLRVGQVIAYKYENKIIVHRLVNIVNTDDTYYFYTKGDANNADDNYVIYEDTVIGVVNVRIPYIGLPTVWLNEL